VLNILSVSRAHIFQNSHGIFIDHHTARFYRMGQFVSFGLFHYLTFLLFLDELFKDMLFLLHGLLEARFEILVYGEGEKGNGTRNCEMV
jgi:hypothetical protein